MENSAHSGHLRPPSSHAALCVLTIASVSAVARLTTHAGVRRPTRGRGIGRRAPNELHMYESTGANDVKRYLNIRNTVRAALALVVFVVVIVSLGRLVGDVPTWLAVVLMGTV